MIGKPSTLLQSHSDHSDWIIWTSEEGCSSDGGAQCHTKVYFSQDDGWRWTRWTFVEKYVYSCAWACDHACRPVADPVRNIPRQDRILARFPIAIDSTRLLPKKRTKMLSSDLPNTRSTSLLLRCVSFRVVWVWDSNRPGRTFALICPNLPSTQSLLVSTTCQTLPISSA